MRNTFIAALFITPFAFGACDDGPGPPVIDPGDDGNYQVKLDPANFVDRIAHPFLPFTPGSTWVYESVDGAERIEIVVLQERRTVMGVSATVVRDTVTEDGEIIENTFDWFAQDRAGNVWYLGEDSTEYEDGKPANKHGSWEAGIDGALPGIVMLANPTVGHAYRQEYYKGEAEDLAEILNLSASQKTRGGDFSDLLVIREWNPLDPGVVEEKYYARGVGLVFERKTRGGKEEVELVSFTK